MESTTIFLAQLIGPTMLAVGLGIFFSRSYYEKVYRNLENETLSVLVSGIAALVIGILMVLNHNVWNSLLSGIVTLVGWLSIVKGLLLIIVPRKVDKLGDWMAGKKGWFTFAAFLYMGVGAYVTYMVYMYYVLS